MTVKLYSKAYCPHCANAKAKLNDLNIAFEEVNIEGDPSARQYLVEQGFRTVPQIFVDNELLVEGGWQGLRSLNDQDIYQRVNIITEQAS